MDVDVLTELVCEAVLIALQRHKDRNAVLTEEDRGDIKAHIESIYVLRERAADQNLALLEIGCDAAAQFARDLNYQNPASPPMEPKWAYILIQALLAPHLKLELVEGDVPSLSELLDADVGIGQASVAAMNNNAVCQENAEFQYGSEKAVQSSKSFWSDHEIRQLIWLQKYKALHQIEVARKLGRTLHSVTNKWAKVAKDEDWKNYMAECESSRTQGGNLSRPATPS